VTPQPGPSSAFVHFLPQDVLPLPHAPPRAGTSAKGHKRGRCRILTDTPEKAEREADCAKKVAHIAVKRKAMKPSYKLNENKKKKIEMEKESSVLKRKCGLKVGTP
jgi:hypothetical protein